MVIESTRGSSNKTVRDTARFYHKRVSYTLQSSSNGISLTGGSATASRVQVARRATSSSLVRIKPEASEPTIPRKRLSDTAFGSTKFERDQPHDTSLSKRVKVETAIQKTPLAQVTNTANSSKVNSSITPSVEYFDAENNKLVAINLAIVDQQYRLDSIEQKRVKSNEDWKNAEKYNREIARLNTLKHADTIAASEILSLNVKNERVVKQESGCLELSVIMPTPFNPMVDRKPQPFPLAMDVDYKSRIEPGEPSGSSSTIPQRQESASAKAAPFTPPQLQPPFPAFTQPIASGSKPSMHEPYGHELMDVDGDSDGHDSDFYGYADVANEVIDKIGIKVPPPIIADAHDSNGDYYGRDHDIFVGPRAQAGECVLS